jgi:DDE domain
LIGQKILISFRGSGRADVSAGGAAAVAFIGRKRASPGLVKWFYKTPEWKRLRYAHLAKNPACVFCGRSTHDGARMNVDHIKPLSKLLRTTRCQPCVILTDKLRSYGAAKKIVLPPIAYRQSRYLNHRAKNSPQPTRPRERRMKRFQSPEQAQRFLEIHDIVAAHFRPKRHLLSAAHYQNVTAPMQRLQL